MVQKDRLIVEQTHYLDAPYNGTHNVAVQRIAQKYLVSHNSQSIHTPIHIEPPYSQRICGRFDYCKLCLRSLTYNHHVNQSYVSDVCMEPIFWFVDNFTHLLGPVSLPTLFYLRMTNFTYLRYSFS